MIQLFYLQLTSILSTKFRVNWLFGSGEVQSRFSKWQQRQPFWISDRNGFSYFDIQVSAIRLTKFRDSWPFGSGEVQNSIPGWRS